MNAPDGIGPVLAAADALWNGSARALLVRPALPWESYPVPSRVQAQVTGLDTGKWSRALRGSAVILYDLGEGRFKLAGGLELSRVAAHHEAMRSVLWRRAPDGGIWRCVDGRLRERFIRLTYFRGWRGDWLELTLEAVVQASPAAAPVPIAERESATLPPTNLAIQAPPEDA